MLAPMAPAPPVTTATRVMPAAAAARFRAGAVCPRRRFRARALAEDHRVGQAAAVLDQVSPDQAHRARRVEPGDRLAIGPQHPGPLVVTRAAGCPGDARPGLDRVQAAGVQRDQGVRRPAEQVVPARPGRSVVVGEGAVEDDRVDADLFREFPGSFCAPDPAPVYLCGVVGAPRVVVGRPEQAVQRPGLPRRLVEHRPAGQARPVGVAGQVGQQGPEPVMHLVSRLVGEPAPVGVGEQVRGAEEVDGER